ncbi:palmitoyltransferase ZDHHC22-like [Liolophura sinensis]|uniref:palmitoyltransferase ZDHHC22-like n=1 Tax=Liolophura sinensis TaxID=3198878 RepID=UPI00315970E9
MFPNQMTRNAIYKGSDVALTSLSSTTPTIRETWRTVQPTDDAKYADAVQNEGSVFGWRKKGRGARWIIHVVNIAGMIYYVVLSSVLALITYYVTLPAVYTNDSLTYRRILLHFLFINMMLNYILLQFYGRRFHGMRSGAKPLLPTHTRTERAFCERCQATVVARAKHCYMCDVCVLKRDHHCFFAGCCVGFHNQRYFVVFCFYASLGSLFCLYIISEHLRLTYANIFSYEVYRFLLPWCLVEWLFRGLSSGTLAMIFLFYMTIPTCLGCIWFAVQQFWLIYRGQTTYEYLKGIKTYRTFTADHFRSVFGSFWPLNFILPMPWFRQHGNGKDWNVLKHV